MGSMINAPIEPGPKAGGPGQIQYFAQFGVTEAMIRDLVHRFYARVRADAILGPIFNGAIEDVNYDKSKVRVSVTIFGRATPVELDFSQGPPATNCYSDAALNRLLDYYASVLPSSHLLFPCGPLACLASLRGIARDRLFLMSADKGFHHLGDLAFGQLPELAHHGCISMMVNYHALGQYTTDEGGQFLATRHRHECLDICGFLFGLGRENSSEIALAYEQFVELSSPDDFYVARNLLRKNPDELSLGKVLSILRGSCWDTLTYLELHPRLLELVPRTPELLKDEIRWAAGRVWDSYYHVGERADLGFALGLLYFNLGDYAQALERLRDSLRLHGEHAATLYNLAMCYQQLGQISEARSTARKSLALDPRCEPARALLLRLASRPTP